MEKNLTTGSVGRQLIGFSLPYLLSYLQIGRASCRERV